MALVAFSPDGALLATGAYHGELKAWDLRDFSLRIKLEAREGVPICG